MRDSRSLQRSSPVPTQKPSSIESRSWVLCSLVGPQTASRGVYGTDLGFSVKQPGSERLSLLFGDTIAKPVEGCEYPVFRSDDLQGSLPAVRPAGLGAGPPTGEHAAACQKFEYRVKEQSDPTTWERIRLFANTSGKEAALMDTGVLRTPVTAFSDGQAVFAVFIRSDPAYCKAAGDCPAGMSCSKEPGFRGKAPGVCANPPVGFTSDPTPTFCRDGSECGPLLKCKELERGVCMASAPYPTRAQDSTLAPSWYQKDPRQAVAKTMYLARALWPERPADYAVVQRFVTNRFVNVASRTIAHFDAEHPEKNDYRPGNHTLLMWGRPAFVGAGGMQSLPFLLYAPIAALSGTGGQGTRFEPRFFAGFDVAGKARWSERESDAQPLYGTEADVTVGPAPDGGARPQRMHWQEPEFDYVNQMSVSYVAPLQRWVMFYGGDVPGFMVMTPESGKAQEPIYAQPAPGAIHMRRARHPWGRLTRDRPTKEGWSSPEPVLTRQQASRFMVCGDANEKLMPGCIEDSDPHGPFEVFRSIGRLASRHSLGEFLNKAGSCIAGDVAQKVGGALDDNRMGRLYGANIIEEWTEDVTDRVTLKAGETRAADVYWNASTWNPYQVVLVKSELREGD
ncbi:MAG TPA: hypothetical protein VK524_15325 [Polyangiaceae bacterium]|nr:hypothetical protein [Polyangiaceae bacterium]